MQHAFNFTLEKMICLKKHNNSIKVGLFCLYFETKKMRFFAYKKRRREYQMPLFEIVGCTSTKMTYSVGFAFLHFELGENFTWALTMVKGLLSSKDNMPKVIVTDRDGALRKVVGTVFPETYTMLCFFLYWEECKG